MSQLARPLQMPIRQCFIGVRFTLVANHVLFSFLFILEDQLLSDLCNFRYEADRSSPTDFFLLKGYAGAGKTVLLMRLAWDAATTWNKTVLFANADCRLNVDALHEIVELSGERVFVFIDKPSARPQEIERAVSAAKAKKIRVTFICAERTNEWHIECQSLGKLLDDEYELKGLNESEITSVIEKLEKHNCLGSLSGQSRENQQKAFREYANRQLLVALYEVTSGASFEDTVFDEYRKIVPDEAQYMYLVVCSLNRLRVLVRAGIVKRSTGISFSDFKEKFFGPLDRSCWSKNTKPLWIWGTGRDTMDRGNCLRARTDQRGEKFDLYIALLEELDVGYQSDRTAFREIVRARSLLRDFGYMILSK